MCISVPTKEEEGNCLIVVNGAISRRPQWQKGKQSVGLCGPLTRLGLIRSLTTAWGLNPEQGGLLPREQSDRKLTGDKEPRFTQRCAPETWEGLPEMEHLVAWEEDVSTRWNLWMWSYLEKGTLQMCLKLTILRWGHSVLARRALNPMTSVI